MKYQVFDTLKHLYMLDITLHTSENDDKFDPDIEYITEWRVSSDNTSSFQSKTLKELFENLYEDGVIYFNTEEKKALVRKHLNEKFYYKEDGITIMQMDISKPDV